MLVHKRSAFMHCALTTPQICLFETEALTATPRPLPAMNSNLSPYHTPSSRILYTHSVFLYTLARMFCSMGDLSTNLLTSVVDVL